MPIKLKLAELQRMLSVALGRSVVINVWHYPLHYIYRRKDDYVLVMPMGMARRCSKYELLFMIVRGLEKAVTA